MDLKGAITQYLKNEFDPKKLKDIRFEIASRLVPKALSYAEVPVDIPHVQTYINVLTNEINSEGAKLALSYLSSLLGKKMPRIDELEKIEETAKLHLINRSFLDNLGGNIQYGELNYNNVKFEDRNVYIKKDIPKDKLLNLIPEPRVRKAWIYDSFLSLSIKEELDIDKELKDRRHPINRSSVVDKDVKEIFIGRIRERILKEFDDKDAKRIRGAPRIIRYEIVFDEGIATTESIVLTKYSPRVESILDQIL